MGLPRNRHRLAAVVILIPCHVAPICGSLVLVLVAILPFLLVWTTALSIAFSCFGPLGIRPSVDYGCALWITCTLLSIARGVMFLAKTSREGEWVYTY
jgi:hypothetical protein